MAPLSPSYFISRATLDSEQNWTALDLEAAAVVWSIKRLRGYLRGTKLKVLTDSSALQNIGKIADHNPRVSGWAEFFGAYTYAVHHRPGTQNGNADMLSRLPLPATEEDRSGHARLTYPDEVASYTIRATASLPSGPTPAGVGLGELMPPDHANTLGGLPLTEDDFSDFRRHGPRMKLDNLAAPSGDFEHRATQSKFTPRPQHHLQQHPRIARADKGTVFAITRASSSYPAHQWHSRGPTNFFGSPFPVVTAPCYDSRIQNGPSAAA